MKIKPSVWGFIILLQILVFQVDVFAQVPKSGKHIERYENGKVKLRGKWANGQKQGNWFYYTPTHILQKRERYKNGKLKQTFNFNEKGLLINVVKEDGTIVPKKACGCG